MGSILHSIQPLYKQYKIEFIMLSIALFIALISGVLFFKSQSSSDSIIKITETSPSPSAKTIQVDIEGAVQKPGIYELEQDERLKDIIAKAGGLSKEADQYFFARNFNLASILRDQEKIYIPTLQDSESLPQQTAVGTNSSAESTVNINTAERDELDSLTGIGPVTVDKIILSRPYSSIDELVSKKILKTSVFEKIQDQLSL